MKALSLYQPHATLVTLGAKKIETRGWATPYRGWLGIHASRQLPWEYYEAACQDFAWSALEEGGYVPSHWVDWVTMRKGQYLPLGAMVGVANLHRIGEIRHRADGVIYLAHSEIEVKGNELRLGDYRTGRKGWVLTNPWPLKEPIPCNGHLGCWDVPAEIEAEIVRQLPHLRSSRAGGQGLGREG